MRVAELPTPALLLDRISLNRTSAHGRTRRTSGKKLRPHAKAHKCPAIAKRQMEAGAIRSLRGDCREAELMASVGNRQYLVDQPSCRPATSVPEWLRSANGSKQVGVVVDHPEQVRLYAKQQIDSTSK